MTYQIDKISKKKTGLHIQIMYRLRVRKIVSVQHLIYLNVEKKSYRKKKHSIILILIKLKNKSISISVWASHICFLFNQFSSY